MMRKRDERDGRAKGELAAWEALIEGALVQRRANVIERKEPALGGRRHGSCWPCVANGAATPQPLVAPSSAGNWRPRAAVKFQTARARRRIHGPWPMAARCRRYSKRTGRGSRQAWTTPGLLPLPPKLLVAELPSRRAYTVQYSAAQSTVAVHCQNPSLPHRASPFHLPRGLGPMMRDELKSMRGAHGGVTGSGQGWPGQFPCWARRGRR